MMVGNHKNRTRRNNSIWKNNNNNYFGLLLLLLLFCASTILKVAEASSSSSTTTKTASIRDKNNKNSILIQQQRCTNNSNNNNNHRDDVDDNNNNNYCTFNPLLLFNDLQLIPTEDDGIIPMGDNNKNNKNNMNTNHINALLENSPEEKLAYQVLQKEDFFRKQENNGQQRHHPNELGVIIDSAFVHVNSIAKSLTVLCMALIHKKSQYTNNDDSKEETKITTTFIVPDSSDDNNYGDDDDQKLLDLQEQLLSVTKMIQRITYLDQQRQTIELGHGRTNNNGMIGNNNNNSLTQVRIKNIITIVSDVVEQLIQIIDSNCCSDHNNNQKTIIIAALSQLSCCLLDMKNMVSFLSSSSNTGGGIKNDFTPTEEFIVPATAPSFVVSPMAVTPQLHHYPTDSSTIIRTKDTTSVTTTISKKDDDSDDDDPTTPCNDDGTNNITNNRFNNNNTFHDIVWMMKYKVQCPFQRQHLTNKTKTRKMATTDTISRNLQQQGTPPATKASSTFKPTFKPTSKPTFKPTFKPTLAPTRKPTLKPTLTPTRKPTLKPTLAPTRKPTLKPTLAPTFKPTAKPTSAPTFKPTAKPTLKPTFKPTAKPTLKPTSKPTTSPTLKPTSKPTTSPTLKPTNKPTAPTVSPTSLPTADPASPPSTLKPTMSPTSAPTFKPTFKPTSAPTLKPTLKPTLAPTMKPTLKPTSAPTFKPTAEPTSAPTLKPTLKPTSAPTREPTLKPTSAPTFKPTAKPTSAPTLKPTLKPTAKPTLKPTLKPTTSPTSKPTNKPTGPTVSPTSLPTADPASPPSTFKPTTEPTSIVRVAVVPVTTSAPALLTSIPTSNPASISKPTSAPTSIPTSDPASPPATTKPTASPTSIPTSDPASPPATSKPTAAQTPIPTSDPASPPAASKPTAAPTSIPTADPASPPATLKPTAAPTSIPTADPASPPATIKPTSAPTSIPTADPASPPVTLKPISSITANGTLKPTSSPIQSNLSLISQLGIGINTPENIIGVNVSGTMLFACYKNLSNNDQYELIVITAGGQNNTDPKPGDPYPNGTEYSIFGPDCKPTCLPDFLMEGLTCVPNVYLTAYHCSISYEPIPNPIAMGNTTHLCIDFIGPSSHFYFSDNETRYGLEELELFQDNELNDVTTTLIANDELDPTYGIFVKNVSLVGDNKKLVVEILIPSVFYAENSTYPNAVEISGYVSPLIFRRPLTDNENPEERMLRDTRRYLKNEKGFKTEVPLSGNGNKQNPCPSGLVMYTKNNTCIRKVVICHRTGSQTNPYVVISISNSAYETHLQHHDDSLVGEPYPGGPKDSIFNDSCEPVCPIGFELNNNNECVKKEVVAEAVFGTALVKLNAYHCSSTYQPLDEPIRMGKVMILCIDFSGLSDQFSFSDTATRKGLRELELFQDNNVNDVQMVLLANNAPDPTYGQFLLDVKLVENNKKMVVDVLIPALFYAENPSNPKSVEISGHVSPLLFRRLLTDENIEERMLEIPPDERIFAYEIKLQSIESNEKPKSGIAGPALGAVVGGSALIALIASLMVVRRRRKTSEQSKDEPNPASFNM